MWQQDPAISHVRFAWAESSAAKHGFVCGHELQANLIAKSVDEPL
jgi:hypothetical protein